MKYSLILKIETFTNFINEDYEDLMSDIEKLIKQRGYELVKSDLKLI